MGYNHATPHRAVLCVNWLGSQFNRSEPGFWLLASLAVAVIAANLAWLVLRRRASEIPATASIGLSAFLALGWLLVSLFYLLIPLAAWQRGALSPYNMGLEGIDWSDLLGRGGLLTIAVIAALLLGWLVYRHSLPEGPRVGGAWWRAALDAALWQWHCAFYRALSIELLAGWLGFSHLQTILADPGAIVMRLAGGAPAFPEGVWQATEQPLYWGAWLGLGFILLEWGLDPFNRASLRSPGRRMEHALLRLGLAVTTTALFVMTRNFWLCLVCQVTVEAAIAGWFPAPAPLAIENG